ncbi:carbohydrate ABC transporter permease [Paenibacillus sp. PAMC21692]|uniref:carbohydrate ABC transporter permease n=1 Tax=Paenibacillus sp. PAMC21692 TaxID=2762320 RepID=UPI00164DF584|nr:carbohydrate ABC transporter permease [Paenibacillus sp. PAMC21692]QNK57006.1 carbohydrate ABC transporter permease [Paenibacillus sp. PAMC21692]
MVMGRSEKLYMVAVYIILGITALSVIFPLLYVVAVSLTPYSEVVKNGGFAIIPSKIDFETYMTFLRDSKIPRAYQVTIFITVVGTLVNLILTTLMAYPLSKKNMPLRNVLLMLIVFTMLFGGGIIPTYLIVKDTGLIDSIWAMIIPNSVATFYLLIMKTFFEGLPESLDEAAKIDGASELTILWKIVLPLSMPIMATVGLFYAVGHWNEFFNAIIYVSDNALHPLQVILRGMLNQSELPELDFERVVPTESLQMAAVVLSTLPIVVVYPFIQKYFTQGALLGSVKG